ncbi:MAG: hypothetical protein M5R38_06320 [Candidatus Methylomirabilis sp.]|nr:hypothetical protein [Candidatus Methylomirabilis sp.]
MDLQTELKHIESLLLDRISAAVSNRDVAAVAALSSLAKECEALEGEFTTLNRRIEAVKSTLNDPLSTSTISHKPIYSIQTHTTSRKAAAATARDEWVAGLRTHGVSLRGRGKRYQTARGRSVAVAFANELSISENRWFLGLRDESGEVAVLLCKSLKGKLYDIVLPVWHLREVWRVLQQEPRRGEIQRQKGCGPILTTRYWGRAVGCYKVRRQL